MMYAARGDRGRSRPRRGRAAAGMRLAVIAMALAARGAWAEPAHVPEWVADAVFYQIFPERFANGDRSNDPTRESREADVPASWAVAHWTGEW